MSTSSTHFWGGRWCLEFISDSILYLLLFIILFNLSLRMSVGKSIKEGKAEIVVKFYPCGFVLLNSISHWSAKREKYRLASTVGITGWTVMSTWLDYGISGQSYDLESFYFIVSKNECWCSTLLCLINLDSVDEIIRQRIEILWHL